MTIYLAGPMTGIPLYNFPSFHDAAAKLRAAGHKVFNPAETDGGDTTKPWEYYMRKDLMMVLESDAVVVLPGWQKSRGAQLETHAARSVGIPILDTELKPIEPANQSMTEPVEKSESGAIRDTRTGKGRFDLIPASALKALAGRYEMGVAKYGEDNWRKGMKIRRYVDSAMRHLISVAEKDTSEDHAGAVLWNVAAIIETLEQIKRGNLPANLDDRIS